MGLYNVNCPQCTKPHLWFSGNTDQRCIDCLAKHFDSRLTQLKAIEQRLDEILEQIKAIRQEGEGG
jgi:hypothetical protein